MAVVINEFEVVPGDSDTGRQAETSTPSEAGEPSPSPQELERMLEQKLERWERVWAH